MVQFVSLLLFLSGAAFSNGFNPNLVASIAGFTIGSQDHHTITQDAAVNVLRSFLLDNPNGASTSAILDLEDPTAISLFAAYYHGSSTCSQSQCRLMYQQFARAMATIKENNADMDVAEVGIAETHFDNEQIPQGHNRLLEKKGIVVSHIRGGLYQEARREIGRALHTLQDFYSHSNWVEMGNTQPWSVLGMSGARLTKIASSTVPTCNSCDRGATVNPAVLIFISSLIAFDYEYNCTDNILSDIQNNEVVTTGYTGFSKPEGKCSHGGLADFTSTLTPEGGINKDNDQNRLANHYTLHEDAANLAMLATVELVADIRVTVGDEAFSEFLDIERLHTSVAFVVDTTASMSDELPWIQTVIPSIQAQLNSYSNGISGGIAIDYILVPFNDPNPGTVRVTQNATEFANYIQGLTASGGGVDDCREPGIGAIIEAAKYSTEGGVVNVFTDAQPSDYLRLSEAVAIAQEKELTINTFATTGCSSRRRKRFVEGQPYGLLSFLSGGQFHSLPPEDLSNIAPIVVASVELERTAIILTRAGSSFNESIDISVDSTITEFQIVVSGEGLTLGSLTSPQGNDDFTAQLLTSTSTLIVYTIVVDNPNQYGTWQLAFNATSNYRAFVTGDSELSVTSTLYQAVGLVKQKVVQGEILTLLLSMDQGAILTSASILSKDGNQLSPLNPFPVGLGMYGAFIPVPTSPFKVGVVGMRPGGQAFTRVSSVGVDVSDVLVRSPLGQSPYQVLRTGESVTLNLTLSNIGDSSTFRVDAVVRENPSNIGGTPSKFTHTLSGGSASQSVSLANTETKSLGLIVTTTGEVTEEDTLYLQITMTDEGSSERSNYYNIQFTGTTVPPVDLSLVEYYNGGRGLQGSVGCVVTMAALLLGALLY